MTLFVDRKKAFEAKFVHETNLDFKTEARRNRLFGSWVSEKLGLSGKTSEELVSSYAVQGIVQNDQHCILAKATADLNGSASAQEIETKLIELANVARQQIEDAGV